MVQKDSFGYDSLNNLQKIFDESDAKKIFLVTGRKSYSLSGAKKKIKSFLEDKQVIVFNDFSSNPNIVEVKKGIEKYKMFKPDIVLAVGGGSVIDVGKMVNLLANNSEKPIEYIKGLKKPVNPGKLLVAIPTTSGTGSESTHFATVYINKKKYSLSDKKYLLPDVSIVDPSLTFSIPRYLTASMGLDALCQSVESLWAVNSTEESRKYAFEALKISVINLEQVVNNPDKKTRFNIAKAAHLSGKAINISKTTAAHSISYPITSYFGVSHGHAVALSLGQLIEFNSKIRKSDCNDRRGVVFVKERINEIIDLMDCKDASEAKLFFYDLLKKIGIEYSLNKLNIDKKDRDLIVDKGFTPDRMKNNPRIVLKKDVKKMLNEIK